MIICARGALSLDLHGHAGLSPRAMWTRKSYLTSCSSCRIKLAELVNEPWTWSAPGTVFDTLVIDAFRASEAELRARQLMLRPSTCGSDWPRPGPYLAIVPASMFEVYTDYASIKLLPVELPMTQRSIGIIALKNRTLSPLARLFTE
jgi:hypothetical protein